MAESGSPYISREMFLFLASLMIDSDSNFCLFIGIAFNFLIL